MTEIIKITDKEKDQVTEFNKLFKIAPTQITEEIRKVLKAINEKAWNIAKEKTLAVEDRIAAHDIIKSIHEILGMKYDDNWKPKASSGSGGNRGTWIATKEQRKENCEDFIKYVGVTVWNNLTPFEIAMCLAKIWGPLKS